MANSRAYFDAKQKVIAVPGPLVHRPSHLETLDPPFAEPGSSAQFGQSASSLRQTSDSREALPCVLYECNAAYQVTYVSENISEFFGFQANELIGKPLLSDQRVPVEDLVFLSNRLAELEQLNKRTSLIHRMLTRRGLPLWVAHSVWKANSDDLAVIRGCIVPMDDAGRLNPSEQAMISRFVHKIGNHFQLLNLVVNSIKRTVPESRETLMLQETLDKAIELTRSFSDYNQVPTCLSRVELVDILQATAVARRSSFEKKGIIFENQFDTSVIGASVQADPHLLELAIGYVLQNALEATEAGDQVTLQASVKHFGDRSCVAIISVLDSGCGIDEKVLTNVVVPFFTSKKNHDGLGLSMASRFVEAHGGILRVTSVRGKGTAVEIVLPTEVETPTL